MKRIIVRISGGLGNQLFGYAFGRTLEYHLARPVYFDMTSAYLRDPYGRTPMLHVFPNARHDRLLTCANEVSIIQRIGYVPVVARISSLLPLRWRMVVSEPKSLGFHPKVLHSKYIFSPYFIGYWMSPKYFDAIAEGLKHELEPPEIKPSSLGCTNPRIAPSCAIHFRAYREERSVFKQAVWDYYSRAIEQVIQREPKVKFSVFSDAPQEAMDEFQNRFKDRAFECSSIAGYDQANDLIDFYGMYSCDHIIIGDSTFSWWAAWLASRQDKLICAPAGLSPWGKDWIPSTWLSV
jgi:hypothetical protein